MPLTKLPASLAMRISPSRTLSLEAVMVANLLRFVALLVPFSLSLQSHAETTALRPTGTIPLESVTIGANGTDLLVRFDHPISHEQSWLLLIRDGTVVACLHPRLEAQPNVLFARIHTPAKGNYLVHWIVVPEGSNERYDGEFPFMVGDVPPSAIDRTGPIAENSRRPKARTRVQTH
jgi:hypothetical protein